MKCKIKDFNGRIFPVDFIGGKYIIISPAGSVHMYSVTEFEEIFEIVEDNALESSVSKDK